MLASDHVADMANLSDEHICSKSSRSVPYIVESTEGVQRASKLGKAQSGNERTKPSFSQSVGGYSECTLLV